MKSLLALIFAFHGFFHLIRFFVSWRMATMEEMPFRTTILNGKIDLGGKGIRVYGVFWLILALVFFAWSVAVFMDNTWWYSAGLYSILISLILCILAWPDAKTGIALNLLILIFLHTSITEWFH